ncbi:hypothetical protein [Streptomyces marincola]|uniref:Uncharacterized protein n=1 Tax=Streptomyces marincola TaxID=2878388 RepID=A0A1W7CUY8_9ACTN|nr:hypothetical protein [Streptomyces marincola]ARQ68506.1 hypothetical protein CAG99_06235 [Streptomyces marincola]
MSGDIHFGDRVSMDGGQGNSGIVHYHGAAPADAREAYQELFRAITVLRGQVTPENRAVLDESVAAIGTGEDAEPGVVGRALATIAGVAALVGAAGAPVVAAVQQVTALLAP